MHLDQHLVPAVQVLLDDVDLVTRITSIGLLFLGGDIINIRTEADETLSVSLPIFSVNKSMVCVCVCEFRKLGVCGCINRKLRIPVE